MSIRKQASADLKRRYPLYVEVGLITALGMAIIAFKMDWRPEATFEATQTEQEVVQMEEIQQTQQAEQPPPPPRPPVPVEVPNDEVLENDELDLDASLDLDDAAADLPLPPPPAPPSPQEEQEEEVEIFIIVEEMPELIGGLDALQKRISYPDIARKAGVEGRVIVQFVVDEQGRVASPEVVRGIGAGCDEEALRAVREVTFKPGKQRGRAVRVKMSLPVTFRLR